MAHDGTLERFAGDGMMVFFNDPVPVPDPAVRAVRMVLAMHERLQTLTTQWQKHGFELEFGAGIAQGYATIGAIGFEGRLDYGAIGTVTNLAARLCGEAQPGQVLISKRVLASVDAAGGGGAGRRVGPQGFREAGAGVQHHRVEARVATARSPRAARALA